MMFSTETILSAFAVPTVVEILGLVLLLAITLVCTQLKQSTKQPKAAAVAKPSGASTTKTARHGHGKVAAGLGHRKGTRNLKPSADLSSESTDDLGMSGRSFQSSDTDASSVEFPNGFHTSFGWCPNAHWTSSGLVPPPGLPVQTEATLNNCALKNWGTRLNSEALPFVPDFGIPAAGIGHGACAYYGVGYPEPEKQAEIGFPLSGLGAPSYEANQLPWSTLQHQGECPRDSANQLNDVISKLSPKDAATVLACLNAAQAGSTSSSMCTAPSTAWPETFPSAVPAGVKMPVVVYPHPVGIVGNTGPGTRNFAKRSKQDYEQHTQRNTAARCHSSKAHRPPLSAAVAEGSTLRDNLQELSVLDPKLVILVRKINKLGLNSPQLLEIYFSKFGPVERVLISHSIENPGGYRPRWRPAGLGFVVMKNAEDATAATNQGSEQVVLGVPIFVGMYEDHQAAKTAEAE